MSRRLVGTMAVVAAIGSVQAPAVAQTPLACTRVRPADADARVLLVEALQDSPTVRGLVEAIDRSDLVVYVESAKVPTTYRAHTQFVAATSGGRYLRLSVSTSVPRKKVVSLLAHELQHAVEISQAPEVVDQESLEVLYRRIGRQTLAGGLVSNFETPAAQAVERRVLRELWGASFEDSSHAGGHSSTTHPD